MRAYIRIISKCSECIEYAKFGMADCGLTKKIIFADVADTIDKDCPLKKVEVIRSPNDIDHITIVKKRGE